MCSIYGCIGKNFRDIESTFSKELHHRGPDDSGFYVDNEAQVSLGHTRLSIIDLSTNAHQPMSSKNDRYTIVFNGEVYNYREIKRDLENMGVHFFSQSDTEVVLQSFIAWGEKCLDRFRGMFAFAVYDKHTKELFLARDRFGIKPLIYTFADGQFIFTSELSPLMKSGLISSELDEDAVKDYFTYGAVQQPKTILRDVFHLPPSHYMWLKPDLSYQIRRYYDYVDEAKKLPTINSYNEAVRQVRHMLEEVTQYHMVSDVEVGAFLSGGVDSTATVALMNRHVSKPINTFSVGFACRTEVDDERSVAANTAKFLGTEHHEIVLDDAYIAEIFDEFIASLDQPSIDGINTYIVSKETSKSLKVALSGLGGDEIFAGYPHFMKIMHASKRTRGVLSRFGSWLNSLRPNRFTIQFAINGLAPEKAMLKMRSLRQDSCHETTELPKTLSTIQRVSKTEIDHYMLNTLLRDNDVLSMAHSLEVRPILLDHKLLELAFSLPDNFKVRKGRLKSVFVDAVKDIIPEEVWQHKKKGFEMPFTTWMNGVLNAKVQQVAENAQNTKFVESSNMEKFLQRAKNRKLKRKDWLTFVFFAWVENNGVTA